MVYVLPEGSKNLSRINMEWQKYNWSYLFTYARNGEKKHFTDVCPCDTSICFGTVDLWICSLAPSIWSQQTNVGIEKDWCMKIDLYLPFQGFWHFLMSINNKNTVRNSVLEMKTWIYWSESNSWSYFYLYLNKNWKMYWSE